MKVKIQTRFDKIHGQWLYELLIGNGSLVSSKSYVTEAHAKQAAKRMIDKLVDISKDSNYE